ncbi:MAG TPA: hypothetical protein DCZ69_14890 [Syntrophobacteraceae bacterium]|nr:hypothetical protein [Syntrophobacteraceae bacterium]
MKAFGFMRKWIVVGPLLVMAALPMVGCATYLPDPYAPHRVAAASLGMGALGGAIGMAATGDPRWAAVGGLAGMAAGAIAGAAAEDARARAYAEGAAAYPQQERCGLVHTIERGPDGSVIREYDREVCDEYPAPPPPHPYRHPPPPYPY